MNLISAIRHIEEALKKSQKCTCGLATRQRVFGIEQGPSGGPELLATLYLDDPFFGFWYGHVLQHPKSPQEFVAMIVWTDKFINAGSVPLLFQRFHYWIRDRFEYHPCSIQNRDDAYDKCASLEAAASALGRMIMRFDIDKRTGFEGSGFEDSPAEIRIMDIYGFSENFTRESSSHPLPMFKELKLVKSP